MLTFLLSLALFALFGEAAFRGEHPWLANAVLAVSAGSGLVALVCTRGGRHAAMVSVDADGLRPRSGGLIPWEDIAAIHAVRDLQVWSVGVRLRRYRAFIEMDAEQARRTLRGRAVRFNTSCAECPWDDGLLGLEVLLDDLEDWQRVLRLALPEEDSDSARLLRSMIVTRWDTRHDVLLGFVFGRVSAHRYTRRLQRAWHAHGGPPPGPLQRPYEALTPEIERLVVPRWRRGWVPDRSRRPAP